MRRRRKSFTGDVDFVSCRRIHDVIIAYHETISFRDVPFTMVTRFADIPQTDKLTESESIPGQKSMFSNKKRAYVRC